VYAASKWWLRGFAKSVAGRVGPDGVAVSLVNPSGVPTGFARDTRETTNDDRLDPEAVVSAADVADAVLTAVTQDAPGSVAELDLFRRDIYERF
jgi:short-subunit dehydrogenase